MAKKLPSYRGRLTLEKIAQGMSAATKNAARLASDAELLLNAGRIPTACSLAALSIEESGKVSILRALSLARDHDAVTQEWKRYRSHTNKNAQWIFIQLVAGGAKKLDDFRLLFESESDHPYLLDQIKQLGLYTDCLGDRANWSVPEEVIDERLAAYLVKTAIVLASGSSTSVRELELWVEHVGAQAGTDKDSMNDALVSWYQAMQQEGLKPEGGNKMLRFIQQGLGGEDV